MAIPSVVDLNRLAVAVYGDPSKVPAGYTLLQGTTVFKDVTYQVYRAPDGTVVTTIQGTDLTRASDQVADGNILAGQKVDQAAASETIVRGVATNFATNGEKVIVTGQSLGGYDAMFAANKINDPNISAIVFDAPGFGAGLGISANNAYVADIVMQGSFVSGGTAFLGRTVPGEVIVVPSGSTATDVVAGTDLVLKNGTDVFVSALVAANYPSTGSQLAFADAVNGLKTSAAAAWDKQFGPDGIHAPHTELDALEALQAQRETPLSVADLKAALGQPSGQSMSEGLTNSMSGSLLQGIAPYGPDLVKFYQDVSALETYAVGKLQSAVSAAGGVATAEQEAEIQNAQALVAGMNGILSSAGATASSVGTAITDLGPAMTRSLSNIITNPNDYTSGIMGEPIPNPAASQDILHDGPLSFTIDDGHGTAFNFGMTPNAGTGSLTTTLTSTSGLNLKDTATSVAGGNQTDDFQKLNDNGNIQYEQTTIASAQGQVSATVSGTGDVTNLSNASISLSAGSSATIIGGADTVAVGAGASLTLTGNNNALILTATSAVNLTGSGETVSGSGASVTLGANSSATFLGSGNTINAANGDVITEDNAIINVAQGASVTITGTGDTIVAAGNNAISVFGGGDTVNLNGAGNYVGLNGNGSGAAYTVNGDVAGDTVLLNANTTATVTGAGGAVDLWGNGDVVTTSNQTIYTTDHATGEAIIGSGDIINSGTGFAGFVGSNLRTNYVTGSQRPSRHRIWRQRDSRCGREQFSRKLPLHQQSHFSRCRRQPGQRDGDRVAVLNMSKRSESYATTSQTRYVRLQFRTTTRCY